MQLHASAWRLHRPVSVRQRRASTVTCTLQRDSARGRISVSCQWPGGACRPARFRSSSARAPLKVCCVAGSLEARPSSLVEDKGVPDPLGPSKSASGVNFAVYAAAATRVTLLLRPSSDSPATEIEMNRTGDVWHVALGGLAGTGVLYGFKVEGRGGWETGYRWDATRVLLDPYAPLVAGRPEWAVRNDSEQFALDKGSTWWGTFDFDSPEFDWGADYHRPDTPLKDLVVYEMSVRCFTGDPSSGVSPERRGTYLGVVDKLPHLMSLGVNAVELLPVFEYDELEFKRWRNPRDHMVNVWGYSHMSFLAPMSRFGTRPGTNGGSDVAAVPARAAREFKEMVRALHAAGIQVILDVVYNHTAELDDKHPYTISFRGIDAVTYYMVDPTQYVQLINYSGCGNTVNANHPVVRQLILDSLVTWVTEYHVDGFRFDLASCLCRDGKGNPMPAPPLIRDIAKHPILGKVHLIAEPWDLGLFQVGSFPNWDVWAEWNGIFRDDLRRFIKGDAGMKGALATRMSGSADLYHKNNRKPYHSINFITAHDGFSLYDLVAYNSKRNGDNGENNNDGTNDNLSWNCGTEGDDGANEGVLALRFRQMRNFLLSLMVAQGTPMIVMGDEIAQTHYGNNNWYGHDTRLSWVHWDAAQQPQRAHLLRFTSEVIKFRRGCPLLGRGEFLSASDITWHETNWGDPESRFLAWTLHDTLGAGCGDVYIAFNAHSFEVQAALPAPPRGHKWSRFVDTNLPPPRDVTPGGNAGITGGTYGVQAHSAIVLLSKPA